MSLPTTDLELVNIALAKLGHTVQVVSLSGDQTPEAKAGRMFIDVDRDRALASLSGPGAGWKWAQKRAVLVTLAGQSHERWTYFYTPPADWVPGTGWFYMGHPNPNPDAYPEWEAILTAAGSGRCIACNLPVVGTTDPAFVYTSRVTNVALYPQPFVEFFTWMLAADFVMPLKRDRKERVEALQEMKLAYGEAVRSELSGMQTYQPPPTLSVRARR